MQLKVKLTVIDPNAAALQELGPLRLRVLSEWADCCTLSEPFGADGELAWVEEEQRDGATTEEGASASFSATFTCDVEPKLNMRPMLEAFNKDPGMYAVLLKEGQYLIVPEEPEEGAEPAEPEYEPQLVPIGFIYADCSIFLIDTESPINVECVLANGLVTAAMEVLAGEPLAKQEVVMPLEPLVLHFGSLSGYPVLAGEDANKVKQSVYIYGAMDIGGLSILRKFYARPRATPTPNTSNEEGNNVIQFDSRVCVLPGLVDLPRFKESLTSSTYNLGIYYEDEDGLFLRSFHSGIIQDYHKALKQGEGGQVLVQASGAMTSGDRILFKAITRALEGSSHTQPHGFVPFRLEQLLSSSVDLLKEFAIKRLGKQNGDENVTLREDIISEVRLERPSKPLRWKTPDDMSLKSALQKEKGLKTSVKRIYVKPRHERFDEEGTVMLLSAELRRTLVHPKETPKIMHKPKVMNTLSQTFSQARLDSTMLLSAEDQRLRERLQLTPFTRMVFVLKFDDDETLLAINNSINKVNSATLCDIQGSLRSYSFTPEEISGCVDGSLDVITGFMVIDDDMRIAVLEGLAAPGCGMQSLFMDIPRNKPNDSALKILANPEVLFPTRLYSEFGPDLKRIRIRNKLKKLARRPELYNRKQVEIACFDAVDSIMSLRWAPDLMSTKDFDLYPLADSLNKVELLYGEAISRSDLDGTAAEAQRIQILKEKKARMEARKNEENYTDTDDMAQSTHLNSQHSLSVTHKVKDSDMPRCAPTDCFNPEFTAYLKSRPEHRVDYLSEQKTLLGIAYEQSLRRMQKREEVAEETMIKVFGPDGANTKIYVYGSQAQNFTEKALALMRSKISKEKDGATYTYSKDFISQTVCVVDEQADRKAIKAEKETHWLTPSGFQYPKPKTLQDLITHPKRPSDSRIQELSEQWDGDKPKDFRGGSQEELDDIRLERGYTNRIRGGNDFGKLKIPEYKGDFELKKVGDRRALPRGAMIQGQPRDKDPHAFRSVHLGGPGQAKIVEEAEEAERKAWADAVVVDNTSFMVGGFCIRDKTLQFQRQEDILHGEPKRKELIFLRERKSVGGRDFSYAPPPLSITSQGEYISGAGVSLGRKTDPTKFTLTKEGVTKDFMRYIDRNANAPKIMTVLSAHKNISKLTGADIIGPKWGRSAASMLPVNDDKNYTPKEQQTINHNDYLDRIVQRNKNKMKGKEPQ